MHVAAFTSKSHRKSLYLPRRRIYGRGETKLSGYHALVKSFNQQHVMLLYKNPEDRSVVELQSINEALSEGQLCVYASIDMNDKSLLKKFVSKIPNCQRHIEQGNLLIVNFMPHYNSALAGSLVLFERLLDKIEQTIAERKSLGKSGKTLIVPDAARHLVRNGYINQSAKLESWWQKTYKNCIDKGLDMSIVCAHPTSVLRERSATTHNADDTVVDISRNHSLVLDVKDLAASALPKEPKSRLLHILVAEPEEDMHEIYRWSFDGLPVRAEIVKTGKECLDKVVTAGSFQGTNNNNNSVDEEKEGSAQSSFDVIVIDTHLQDIGVIDLAKSIIKSFPNQKLVITTSNEELFQPTILASNLPLESEVSILAKPFEFAKLLVAIMPAK
jgi:CheY-like chemotaxis protein